MMDLLPSLLTGPSFSRLVMDGFLIGLNLYHVFVAACYLAVPDAFYKRTLLQWHHTVASQLYRAPMQRQAIPLALVVITLREGYQTSVGGNDTAARAIVSGYTLFAWLVLQKWSNSMVKVGVDRVMEMEQEVERQDIQQWTPPSLWFLQTMLTPLTWVLRPVVMGADNLDPDRPSLLVSNHSLFGLEMAHFVVETFAAKGIFLRGLGDYSHFGQPFGELLRWFGGVNGSRENVDWLMQTNCQQHVLVYPGGCHEIMKPTSVPKYQLMWKQRVGFVRMAIKHGYPIVPCCSVGTEDMMDKLGDIDLNWMRKDLKLPIIGPVMPWRLQRVYFWYGKPISTSQYKGDYKNEAIVQQVRDQVKAAVEAGIQELQQVQAKDPNRFLYQHMINSACNFVHGILKFCQTPYSSTCIASPISLEPQQSFPPPPPKLQHTNSLLDDDDDDDDDSDQSENSDNETVQNFAAAYIEDDESDQSHSETEQNFATATIDNTTATQT